MKSKYLLLTLLASAGLVAADAPTPAAAPAAEAPKADAPVAAPAAEAPKTKVPGVADATYDKFKAVRKLAEKEPEVIAAKSNYEAAKKKADENAADTDAKKASDAANTAYKASRKAACLRLETSLTSDDYNKCDKQLYLDGVKNKKNKDKKDAAAAPEADAKK